MSGVRPEERRHGVSGGQALVETLLVVMLAVPLLLGILFLFELQAAQQATLAAARQALFHHHYARGSVTPEEAAGSARREHLESLFASGLGTASSPQASLFVAAHPASAQRVEDTAFLGFGPRTPAAAMAVASSLQGP